MSVEAVGEEVRRKRSTMLTYKYIMLFKNKTG